MFSATEEEMNEMDGTHIPFVVWDTKFRLYEDDTLYAWRTGNEYWYIPNFPPNKNKPGKMMTCIFSNNHKKRKGFYKNRLVYFARNPDWNIYDAKTLIPSGKMTNPSVER